MKSADHLDAPLNDAPTPRPRLRDDQLPEDAVDLLYEIRRLRDDDRYRFAESTLLGIQTSIETTGRTSKAQWAAVKNIEEGGNRQRVQEGNWKRRYEGY